MVSRDSGDQDQALEWGPEGELVKVTGGLSSTEYVYDADGERLLRRANGATTLYLPGMEVTWDPAEGTEEATRYFSHAGETVAVRENDGSLSWVMSDHHGTGQIAVDADFSEVSQRRMTVFGQDRGTTGTWPGERGFVDGMIDASTGLTQLGARSYDADLGRFISVDPLMDLVDAQTMNGYAYANNSPATYSDSSGLSYCTHADGICMEAGGNTTVTYKHKGKSHVETWNNRPNTGWRKITHTQYHHTSAGTRTNYYSYYNAGSGWSGWRDVKPPAPVVQLENHTLSSSEQAMNESIWAHDVGRWAGRAGSWANDRWDNLSDHFSANWRNYAAGAVTVVGGIALLACTAATVGVCAGAAGVAMTAAIGASTSMGAYYVGNNPENRSANGLIVSGLAGGAGGGLGKGVQLFANFGRKVTARSFADNTLGQVFHLRNSNTARKVTVGWSNF